MLRIELLIDITTYYFSSEPLEYGGVYHDPRIVNPYEISRVFSYADKTGSRKRTVGIRLSNHDQFFNSIQTTYGLLNQKFTLYFEDGTGSTQKMIGRCTSINGFGTEIDLTISESGFEYLTDPIPDAQVAYDYYSEQGINANWNAIPICIGYCNRVPTMWVDKFNSRFIVCSGPIKAIKKVYFERTCVYDVDALLNGYKPTPESKNIKVRIYRGSGSVGSPEIVDSKTSEYPGFCYIELYDEATGNPIDPIMADNSTANVYVDLEGITDLADTDMERNPANVIYQLLSNDRTGYRGFGLGIATSDLDFADAISECSTNGWVMDGVINQRNEAGIWLDELCKTCRAALVEEEGKIKLVVDKIKTVIEAAFDEAGEVGYNCNLEPWQEPPIEQQINRIRLFYDMNPETGNWNKSPEFNEESWCKDTNLKNTTHATRIMKWNTNTLELQFIRDDETAHKLAQYYFRRDILQLKTVSFITETTIPTTLDAGSLITITSSKFGWSAKQFLIQEISRTDGEIRIKVKEYDSSIFTYTAITPGTDPVSPTDSPYEIPPKPILNSVTVDANKIQSDGSTKVVLILNATKPNDKCHRVLFYRSLTNNDLDFEFFAETTSGSLEFVWDKTTGGNYYIRAVSVSTTGVYSKLAIESGDEHYLGQPGTATTISIQGDVDAPDAPTITSVSVISGIVSSLAIPGGIPSDFSHFIIKRSDADGSNEIVLANDHRSTVFIDNSPAVVVYTKLFRYAAKAVDKSGNASPYGAWSSDVSSLKVGTDDLDDEIIGKTILSTAFVGDGIGISGIRFDPTGIMGYDGNTVITSIDATDGSFFSSNVDVSGKLYSEDFTFKTIPLNGLIFDETDGITLKDLIPSSVDFIDVSTTIDPAEGSNPFGSTCLLQDGRVFFARLYNGRSLIFDPVTNEFSNTTTSNFSTTGIEWSYSACITMDDGKVLMVPSYGENLVIYDPVADTMTKKALHLAGVSPDWKKVIRMADGKFMLIRTSTSYNAVIYDPDTDSCSDVSDSGRAFTCAIVLADNTIAFIPQAFSVASKIRIYDPAGSTWSDGPTINAGDEFFDVVMMDSGKICLVPLRSTYIGIYDPIANTYTRGPEHGEAAYSFYSGVKNATGKIYFIPWNSENIGVYVPETDTYEQIAHGQSTPCFLGGTFVPGTTVADKIIAAPAGYVGVGNEKKAMILKPERIMTRIKIEDDGSFHIGEELTDGVKHNIDGIKRVVSGIADVWIKEDGTENLFTGELDSNNYDFGSTMFDFTQAGLFVHLTDPTNYFSVDFATGFMYSRNHRLDSTDYDYSGGNITGYSFFDDSGYGTVHIGRGKIQDTFISADSGDESSYEFTNDGYATINAGTFVGCSFTSSNYAYADSGIQLGDGAYIWQGNIAGFIPHGDWIDREDYLISDPEDPLYDAYNLQDYYSKIILGAHDGTDPTMGLPRIHYEMTDNITGKWSKLDIFGIEPILRIQTSDNNNLVAHIVGSVVITGKINEIDLVDLEARVTALENA